ncbi:hypothetical protein C8N46_10215 [Kordia periserrulae]|uniref:Uncharacterized protein n=1 Tax=Kordia periserrulae TaxID=701523 RepID=A0A2T6C2S4_9FLAO|nr:DUF6452 family protein [Kordia periserrulae]PTX62620.1 hypothetical protein C8N46_10215 [Kordia periserrulae]
MKKLSFIGILGMLMTLIFLSFSCEKDDICVEGTITTPLLVIEFFDAEVFNATGEDVLKNTSDLWVEAVDPNTEVINGVEVIVDPIQGTPQAVNTVSIPLRTMEDVTEYRFIKDYALDDDGIQLGNEDIITFNYSREEIFLSRACGYVTNFELSGFDGADVTFDGDNWIDPSLGIRIAETIVQNETVTHVKIYH